MSRSLSCNLKKRITMKKLFLALAITLSSITAFPAMSQQTTSGNNVMTSECKTAVCNKTEKTGTEKKCKARQPRDSKQIANGACAKAMRSPRISPFTGIELTPKQKAQMESLDAERQATENKIKADATKKRSKADQDYDKKLQKILTPEQYARFVANCKKIDKNRKMNFRGNAEKTKRSTKKCCKTDRSDCRKAVVDSSFRIGEMKKGPEPKPVY